MHLVIPFRVRRAAWLGCLLGLVVAVGACGSSTVSQRIAFVDSNGEPQLDTRTITVTKGDTLKLTVGNRTDSQQEFKIDGADVSESVPPDQAVTVEFKAEAPGVYRLYSDADPGVDPLSIVVPA
jgi:hypothetical protein